MDIDFQTILRNFVRNFIPDKDQEQAISELVHAKNRSLFVDRLINEADRIMNPGVVQTMNPDILNRAAIRDELKISERGLCYVISANTALDDKVMEFNMAFDKIYDQGYNSIVLNLKADALYAELAAPGGRPERFIGKK